MKLLKSLWFWLVAIAIILALVVWVTKKENQQLNPLRQSHNRYSSKRSDNSII
jgi:bacteriorhodopsin